MVNFSGAVESEQSTVTKLPTPYVVISVDEKLVETVAPSESLVRSATVVVLPEESTVKVEEVTLFALADRSIWFPAESVAVKVSAEMVGTVPA